MTGKLQVLVLGLMLALCSFATWVLQADMPSSDQVAQANRTAALVHQQLQAAQHEAVLPPLGSAWIRFVDSMSACGVVVVPAQVAAKKDIEDSPTPHWDGLVSGAPDALLTCLTPAAQAIAVSVKELHVEAEKAGARVRVYGTNTDALPAVDAPPT